MLPSVWRLTSFGARRFIDWGWPRCATRKTWLRSAMTSWPSVVNVKGVGIGQGLAAGRQWRLLAVAAQCSIPCCRNVFPLGCGTTLGPRCTRGRRTRMPASNYTRSRYSESQRMLSSSSCSGASSWLSSITRASKLKCCWPLNGCRSPWVPFQVYATSAHDPQEAGFPQVGFGRVLGVEVKLHQELAHKRRAELQQSAAAVQTKLTRDSSPTANAEGIFDDDGTDEWAGELVTGMNG